jgi:transposase
VNVSSTSKVLTEAGQIEDLKRQLHWAHLKIQALEDRLRLQRIAKYGPGSEKLNGAQLQLLELEPGVSHAEVEAESRREPFASTDESGVNRTSPNGTDKKKRKHPGRQELPAGLARVEKVIACAAEQCSCAVCGNETSVIGYAESEQLDLEPARDFVLVTKREKRACKRCPESGVVTAPTPTRIVDKCLASDRIVIGAIVAKYSDHRVPRTHHQQ